MRFTISIRKLMKPKQLLLGCFLLINLVVMSQTDSLWPLPYQYTATRINDLSHTKLEVSFDYNKSYLYGKAWITLQPHFYPTDSLELDAKGMEINKVSLIKGATSIPLKYEYDGLLMHIKLDKTYRKSEQYTIHIDYVAKPDEYAATQPTKLIGAKGLYFINPKGENKEKPTQIWTQGEPDANSVWFPTIDKTNQKTTEEIYMTVPAKYVSLSNGKLMSQKQNSNGTRTDYWKMDLPHAPYLFFMGVGEYAVVKDSWKGKEVSYYVEPEFGPVAKKIFGNTPEMMTYFSRILGVDYPWNKYAQITARDYVAGAMENTTATIHQQTAQQDSRELVDGNSWEETIAHELFHQWFGDYVTTENWTNLTLNESFADYSQTLWDEFKYGKDEGDEENYKGAQIYLSSQSEEKQLVRFYYDSPEDMFDAVSYQKGGNILHMLRNYVGDSAFFKSLNLYLTTNKFKSAEVHQLRLAFEEITGQDLNWFFNQWYYGNGHPKLAITYSYNDAGRQVRMIVKQTQQGQVFRLPVAVDIYSGGAKTRNMIWVDKPVDSFYFNSAYKPDLINFDGDKTLLCEKTENKSIDQYIFQYANAGKYVDRREAIEFCGRKLDDPKAVALIKKALKDPYYGLRLLALEKVDVNMNRTSLQTELKSTLEELGRNDKRPTVKGRAIGLLGKYENAAYRPIFENAIQDSSYSISGYGLQAMSRIDSARALQSAIQLSKYPSRGKLDESITAILIAAGREEAYELLLKTFSSMDISPEALQLMPQITLLMEKVIDEAKVNKGVDMIVRFRDRVPVQYQSQISGYINNLLRTLANKKSAAGLTAQEAYIRKYLPR